MMLNSLKTVIVVLVSSFPLLISAQEGFVPADGRPDYLVSEQQSFEEAVWSALFISSNPSGFQQISRVEAVTGLSSKEAQIFLEFAGDVRLRYEAFMLDAYESLCADPVGSISRSELSDVLSNVEEEGQDFQRSIVSELFDLIGPSHVETLRQTVKRNSVIAVDTAAFVAQLEDPSEHRRTVCGRISGGFD